MTDRHRPSLGIIMLDTNLPPYSAAVRRTFDIVTMGTWFYSRPVERRIDQTNA
jgi:hypothetical protein